MIQYKKLIIRLGNRVVGYIYYQENEVPTIQSIRDYLAQNNITGDISDEEIQSIIDSQFSNIDGELCCIDPAPITPIIEYEVVDNDTIFFSITNYNTIQTYTIEIYSIDDLTTLLSTIDYTEPLGIDLEPGLYKFIIKSETCSGMIERQYDIELGAITVTINLYGNLESNLIPQGTSIAIDSFIGDSITIDSSIIDQDTNLWKISSILVNNVETIDNGVYNVNITQTNNVNTDISFVADNIQQSLIIDIYSNYNIAEWCELEECLECIES